MVDTSTLNQPQAEAVLHRHGPLLVLAGAGSGKTRVVTMRIARLLALGEPGRAILAVTFTNKAAKEMAERLRHLVGKGKSRGVVISTFHSLCSKILRKDAHRIGLSNAFTILDEGDQLAQLSRVAKAAGLVLDDKMPRAILGKIGLWKNMALDPNEVHGQVKGDNDPITMFAARLFAPYSAHLRSLAALDFDDLLLLCRELLMTTADVRKRYQALFRYVHIDEYQDTNQLQFELVRLLVGPHQNLCVVGDDDQSIYGFRGASIENILSFDAHYSPCTIVKLEQNYRSTGHILACANAVIAKNTVRREKALYTTSGDGDQVELLAAEDGDAEAEDVGSRIFGLIIDKQVPPDEIAILYRAGPQSRLFEEALRIRGVPYRVVGGQEFFARREVKDTIAYLSLIARPDDELAFRRVVNLPTRGLGEKAVERIVAAAKTAGVPVVQFAAQEAPGVDLKLAQRIALGAFCKPLVAARAEMAAKAGDEEADLSQIAQDAILKAGLRQLIAEETELKARERMTESQEEVVAAFSSFCDRLRSAAEAPDLEESWLVKGEGTPLEAFLDRIALDDQEREKSKDKDRDKESKGKGKVQLMSLHASKGLEFPYVFFVGFEEGLLPHRRVIEEAAPGGIEEERRLCYVGITRARRHLVLSFARTRKKRLEMVPRKRSRFAEDLPALSVAGGANGAVAAIPEDPAAAFFARMRAHHLVPGDSA